MKDLEPPRDPVDALGKAYELMLERAVDDFHKIDEKTRPLLHEAIDKARQRAVDLNELTREEAEKISDYLRRDLDDAVQYIAESGEDFRSWLGFEVSVIGDRLTDLFTQAADKSVVEWMGMKEFADAVAAYSTGDIVAPGSFVCDQCGEELHIHKPGQLPPCASCMATAFHRKRR